MTQPPPPAAVNPYPATPVVGGGADLGRAGFVVAIIAVALTVGQQIVFALLPLIQASAGVGYSSISLWIGVFGAVHALVSAAALVLGLVGARRRRSLILSGIAIGVGGAGLISGIVGFAVVPMISFVL